MMKFVRSVPMATSGLALGLAALGNLLLPLGAEVRYVCGVLSFIVLIVFALKIFLDFPHAREELKTPVPLSVLPTSTMALMLLCTYIRPFAGDIALYLWYAAVVTHIFIMLVFIKRFIIGFKIDTVYPSWFVAFVGIVTAFRLGNAFLVEQGVDFFAPVAFISMWIAVVIVSYVLIHYVRFFRFVLKF